MSLSSNKKIVLSFEVFPPKVDSDIASIKQTLPEFVSLKPEYISVTYGAGGSTVGYTKDICEYINDELNVPSIAHLTCVGSTKKSVTEFLTDCKSRGIKGILALRGDRRDGADCTDFKHATDLIKFIKDFGGFDVMAACYPEGHIESKDFSQDIEVMKMKADLGVDHFISQLFFDNNDFYNMLELMEKAGVKVPVAAGIMPITNAKNITRMVSISGAKLPPRLTKMIARYENNKDAMRIAGLNYSIDQITDLITNGVKGIHLYTMNNPSTARYILEKINPLIDSINNEL